jgi:hypothetical protein
MPRDILTFHSPDTEFKEPYLATTELKLYGNVSGSSTQQFIEPERHPEHKLLRDVAMFAALIGGIIEAIIAQLGKRTINKPGAGFQRTFIPDYNQEAITGGGSGTESLTGTWSQIGLGLATVSATTVTAGTNVTWSNHGGLDGTTDIDEPSNSDEPSYNNPNDSGIETFEQSGGVEENYQDEFDEYFDNGEAVNEGLSNIFPSLFSVDPLSDHYDTMNRDGGLIPGGIYTAPYYNTELSRNQYVKDNAFIDGLSNLVFAGSGYWTNVILLL